MSTKKSLDSVRRELDVIDDAMHDLLIKRAEVVEAVGAIKGAGAVNLRPGREATILRRLVGRHAGPFPKPALVRIWREIFSAHVGQQGPFSVAVLANGAGDTDGTGGYWDLARDQYGSITPMTAHPSASRVIDTVARGNATIGVLPMPAQDDAEPWWPHLTNQGTNAPRIVARLPFCGAGNSRNGGADALVIGGFMPEQTDNDRTLVVIDMAKDIAPSRLKKRLADGGLKATFHALWHNEQTAGAWLHLAELEGFIDADNSLLRNVAAGEVHDIERTVVLGAYAVPLTPKETAPGKEKRR